MYVKADVDKLAEEMQPYAQHTRRRGKQDGRENKLSTTVGWQQIEVVNFWCEQYPDRYIEKIYAQVASEKTGTV